MKLILGSSSPSRRAVLEAAGFAFEVVPPDVDEKAIRAENPFELPLLIARAKMDALLARLAGPATVIACDQVVVCDGHLEEKPTLPDEVLLYLGRYSDGHPAETVSAVVVANTADGKRAEGVDVAKVFFYPFRQEDAEAYVATGDAFTHAGGFAIEHPLVEPYVRSVEGAPDSVQGLPLELLHRLMAEVG